MVVIPDWHDTCSISKLEEQLKDFKFLGPGLYLSKTDTVIIWPAHLLNNQGFVWSAEGWPPDQLFRVYVYNCPLERTIFGTLIPVAKDAR